MFKNVFKFMTTVFLLAMFAYSQNMFAQLSGPYTIPGTPFATIKQAVDSLNLVGVGTGGVTFNVTAGYTETAPAGGYLLGSAALNATTSVTNTITFQKSGGGANPLITAFTPGTSTTVDGIWKIQGTDYVTIDGIDLIENASNTTATQQMEWGYALVKLSAVTPFDGCQFVTIRNCTVTLNKANTASVGIYTGNHIATLTTSLTILATTDAHNNNKFYGNAITNSYAGISLNGFAAATPFTLYDQNNEIGVTAANTITNFGGGSVSARAIYGIYQNGLKVVGNNISSSVVGSTTTVYGVFLSTGTSSSADINNNTISLSLATGTYTSTVYGINNAMGSTAASNTININNNIFQNCDFSGFSSGNWYAILNSGSAATVNINNNTVNNITMAGTGSSSYVIEMGSPVTGNMNGNNITNITRTGASGTQYGLKITSPTNLTANGNTVDGINFTNTTSTGTVYGFYGLSSAVNVTVTNNIFRNFSTPTTGSLYGIREFGVTGTKTIQNNQVYNFSTYAGGVGGASMYGIYCSTGNIDISSNLVYSLNSTGTTGGTSGGAYGIYVSGGTTNNIYKNKVYDLSSLSTNPVIYGIYIGGGTTNTIFNNLVGDLRCPAANAAIPLAGIYLSGGTTDNVYYNTVYLNATSTGALFGSAAVYASTTPTINFIDNIFVNTSTANGATGFTAAYRRSSTTLSTYGATSNNNDFYAGTPSASNLIFYDGTNSDQTIAAFKGRVTPRDAASFTENPTFVSTVGSNAGFLHINTTIPSQLESGGIPVTGITDDFDGNIRNVTTPDVGADEYTGPALDLTPPSISYTPLLNTNSLAARNIVVNVTDLSGVPTVAPGWPNLYWKKGVLGLWTAVTPSGVAGSNYTFNFGGGVATGDTVFYYVCAQDGSVPPNVGAYPSTGAGGFTANPPAAATPPTNPSSYIISQAALAGNYTVGLTMFNQITGQNIYFEKVITKVMKEVDVEVPQEVKQYAKGQEPKDDNQTSFKPQTIKKLMEVEEISWVPMQNGQPYYGDLYVKKIDSPEFNYPVGTDGIYATITAAVADLNLRGVSGATTFLLNDASYTTGETYPIVIKVANEGNFPTATNTVTIKPNTGVTALIQGASPAGQIFKILSSYVSIDGSNAGGTDRSLTIENTSATTPQVVVIGSTGTTPIVGNTLKNCIIINGATSSTAVVVSDGTAPGTAGYFNNITIQNNNIGKAYMGVYNIAVIAPGNGSGLLITGNDLNNVTPNHIALVGIYVQGVDGATVSNNNIGNYTTTYTSNITGVWFATGTVNSTISNNTIGPINITTAPPRGIVVTSAVPSANVVVNNNIVTGMLTSYSGAEYGIYVFSTTGGVTVEKNKISNIKNTNTGGYSAIGIALGSTLTTANITVANNFIWDVTGYGWASLTTDNGYGINLLSGGGYNVYYNSIALTTEQTATTGDPACLIINSAIITPASLDIRNNIFATFQTVGTQRYALLCNAANTVFSNINYNDYYSLGPNLGYIGAKDRLNLDSLRLGTAQDLQSISGDPNFVSTSDLHINTAYNTVSNNGQPLVAVTTDIDGGTRSATTPDIGADEYVYVIPAVIDPSGVTATAISSSQIDVAFTPNASSNNVVIVYNLTGTFTTPTGTPVVGNTLAGGEVLYINTISPYSHLSLIASTHYYYKLFSYNGTMYSDGVAVDATTLCGVTAAPWTQDFESGVFPPLCWSITPATPSLWNNSTGLAAGISGYGVGTASAWGDFWGISAATPVDLVSFDYNVSALTNAQLKFDWAYQDYSGSADTLKIYYSTDAGTSWTLLAAGYDLAAGPGLFNLITNPALSGEYGGSGNPVLSTHWNTLAFPLPSGTNKVKFTAISDYGNNLFVDNIKVEEAPAHDIGVTALARNFGTLLESTIETGMSREMANNMVDKNGNKIENVSIKILYPEQNENSPDASINLLAVVENFGGAIENSYQVGWYIDGTPQTAISNTQPLEVGDKDTLTLTWAAGTAGSHTARAWTILGTDANAANDSSGILAFYVCPDNAIFCQQFEQGLVPPTGWVTYNQDGGTATPWFVGNPTVFTAYEGSGYIANNYARANGFFIDDWLVTSNTGGIPLENSTVDSLVFWMRSPTGSLYPDSVEIRLSTTGQAVGDFTVLLDYFKVPTTGWTRFAYALPAAANRYVAFRYLMYDGGPSGNNSDYIGLDLVQILRYEVSNTFQLSVDVANGWNMVSIPGLNTPDQNVNTWWQYRDLGANVFKYTGGYQSVTDAVPGTGYWMKHSGARTYNTGEEWPAGGIQIVAHNPLAGVSGWNLIGGYEIAATAANVTTNPPGLQSGPIYSYSGGYQVATTLNPGYGYWIKLTGAGQIIIPETLAKDGKPVEYFAEDWGKITLTDAAGISYTLYAVKGQVDLSQYELPPAPPAGMFDIRYESGRIAEDINSSMKAIDMSGVTYPLTVRVEGMDIRIMDESGKMLNTNLKSGEDVVISESTIQKLMVSGELLPTVYSLEQNYPNPFNPSTVIEFSLPEDVANVKLSIYNALGEKVAELVNTSLQAGRYQYQWNAQNVATGMYIYELRTDNFVSVKKMLLLK